jgi:nucleoside permease NupC
MSLRLLAILGAIIVASIIWLISKAFPNVNHVTVALVLAFGLALAFAFLYKGGRAKRY